MSRLFGKGEAHLTSIASSTTSSMMNISAVDIGKLLNETLGELKKVDRINAKIESIEGMSDQDEILR